MVQGDFTGELLQAIGSRQSINEDFWSTGILTKIYEHNTGNTDGVDGE